MSLRILHTADWHLGARLYNTSREPEHRLFFDWLLKELHAQKTDVLVVAGDIFHYAQPSADATALYYQFLARAAEETVLRQIVIVGGNHDSPARIDAPKEILDAIGVHVVGGLPTERDQWDRCLCPIRNAAGDVELVIVAVPFVHEFRLGVRASGLEPDEAALHITQAFKALYTQMADLAHERFPGAPLLTTGHLTCNGVPLPGNNTPIHMSAIIEGLDADSIFDPRYSYVALGHIHQMSNAPRSNAWYSGSPIALNILEARSPRYVLQVTPDPANPTGPFHTEPLRVPCWRDIYELRGTQEEVTEELAAITSNKPLTPLVWADIQVDHYTPQVAQPLLDTLAQNKDAKSPRLVRVNQTLTTPAPNEDDDETTPTTSLQDLQPEDVFTRLYRTRNNDNTPRNELLEAFRSISHKVETEREQNTP